MSIIYLQVLQLIKAYQSSQFEDFEAKFDKLSIHTMDTEKVKHLVDTSIGILGSIRPLKTFRILSNIRNNISLKRQQQIQLEKKREAVVKKQLQKSNKKRTAQLTKLVIGYCCILVFLYTLLEGPFDGNQKEIYKDVQNGAIWVVFAVFSCFFGLYYKKIASYNLQLYIKSVNMPMDPINSFTYCKMKQFSEKSEAERIYFSKMFEKKELSFYQFNRIQLLINLLDKEQPQEKLLFDLLLPILEAKRRKLEQDLQEAIELANGRFKKVIHFSEESFKLLIILAVIAYQILQFHGQSPSSKGNLLNRTVRDTVTGIILTAFASFIISLYWFFNIYIKIWRTIS